MLQFDVDTVFRALADPTRRTMLERLDDGPATVTALAEPFDISLSAVTQHVRVLERANLITSAKHGRQRMCSLERDTLRRAEAWLVERRLSWERRLNRLEQHLEERDPPNRRTEGRTP